MPITPSPLRYPGGKSALFELTVEMLDAAELRRRSYAEPFAGGAGLALKLLFEGAARRIILNDLDPGIHSFWAAVLSEPNRLVERIHETPVTIDEWHRQRDVHRQASGRSFELGFATFFLNRTNRSGVVKGGVIGGLQQTGAYKLDCRFNKADLVSKIERIARYSDDIELHNRDGADFLNVVDQRDRVVFFVDPPYFEKGSGLYTNFYEKGDHADLASVVSGLKNPWLLTYDNAPEIARLYAGHRQHRFDLNYSAGVKRVGTELMVSSPHFAKFRSERLSPSCEPLPASA